MTGNKNLTFCFKEFYPSNIPYSHILYDIIEECCDKGFDVKIITLHHSDKNKQKKMLSFFKQKKIKASLCKSSNNNMFNDILFPLHTFFHLILYGKGTIIVPSSPPVIMGFSVFLARILGFFRFEYIYHCQDIHPEVLEITKIISNKFILKGLCFMDQLTVRYAKRVITLSVDMKKTLRQRNTHISNNIVTINNFVPNAYCSNPLHWRESDATIRTNHYNSDCIFVFAGNLGVFQNLETLLEGFLSISISTNAHLYFIGEGKIKEQLIHKNNSHTSEMRKNIHFLDKMNAKTVIEFISTADYGIVSISNGILDVAFPSKILTYLSLGLPIFLCGGENSKIDNEINSNHLGISINKNTTSSIQNGIEKAIKNKDLYKKQNIQNYYNRKYNKKKTLVSLIEAIE